jgi:hypothetical protein
MVPKIAAAHPKVNCVRKVPQFAGYASSVGVVMMPVNDRSCPIGDAARSLKIPKFEAYASPSAGVKNAATRSVDHAIKRIGTLARGVSTWLTARRVPQLPEVPVAGFVQSTSREPAAIFGTPPLLATRNDGSAPQ